MSTTRTTDRARYESAIGRASKALLEAQGAAANMGWDGAYEDLLSIRLEFHRLLEDSLLEKRTRRLPGTTRT
jgi:hypothetical protein